MLAREAAEPGSVSSDEWVMSKDDEGLTGLALLFVGVPLFLITSFFGLVTAALTRKRRMLCYTLGGVWICLGGILHAFVWLA